MVHITLMFFIIVHLAGAAAAVATYAVYLKSRDRRIKGFIMWFVPLLGFNFVETVTFYNMEIMKNPGIFEVKSYIAGLMLFFFIYNILCFADEISKSNAGKLRKTLYAVLSLAPMIVVALYFRFGIKLTNALIYIEMILSVLYLIFRVVRVFIKSEKVGKKKLFGFIAASSFFMMLWILEVANRQVLTIKIENTESLAILAISIFLIVYAKKNLSQESFAVVPEVVKEEPEMVKKEEVDAIGSFVEKFGLSQREREVLEPLVEGKTNIEIAARLFISENTVKTHVSNILRKSGHKNRLLVINDVNAIKQSNN